MCFQVISSFTVNNSPWCHSMRYFILFFLVFNFRVYTQVIYKNEYSLTPQGQIKLRLDQKTLQLWNLPSPVRDKVKLEYPLTQIRLKAGRFEICFSDHSKYVLREVNARLKLVDQGKCQWAP